MLRSPQRSIPKIGVPSPERPCYSPRSMAAKSVLGRGLGALIPTRPAGGASQRQPRLGSRARRTRRPGEMVRQIALEEIRQQPVPAAPQISSPKSLQELVESIREQGHHPSRSSSARSVAITNSSPASAAGARPEDARPQAGPGDRPRGERPQGARNGAHRESPARRSQRGRGGAEPTRGCRPSSTSSRRKSRVKVGKSRAAVANAMRLLDLEPQVQSYLTQDRLTVGHAKVLLAVKVTGGTKRSRGGNHPRSQNGARGGEAHRGTPQAPGASRTPVPAAARNRPLPARCPASRNLAPALQHLQNRLREHLRHERRLPPRREERAASRSNITATTISSASWPASDLNKTEDHSPDPSHEKTPHAHVSPAAMRHCPGRALPRAIVAPDRAVLPPGHRLSRPRTRRNPRPRPAIQLAALGVGLRRSSCRSCYALPIGFIGGIIVALVYNLIAKMTGRLEFTTVDVASALPPSIQLSLPADVHRSPGFFSVWLRGSSCGTCLAGSTTVNQNERAVKTRFGRAVRIGADRTTLDDPIAESLRPDERDRYVYPQVRVIGPGGPYLKMPWERIHKVSVATQTLNMALDLEDPKANAQGRDARSSHQGPAQHGVDRPDPLPGQREQPVCISFRREEARGSHHGVFRQRAARAHCQFRGAAHHRGGGGRRRRRQLAHRSRR